MRAVDVHGFGGGFTLGAVQAGWELVAKKSREVGFGVLNTLANRHLLGDQWESQAEHPDYWTPEEDVQMVFGNPPCSGFSTLTSNKYRGVDAKINDCMWELVRYAGMVKPEIVIFESVQQAFTQGRALMRDLWAELEEMTGQQYALTHVLHNNASVGGCSIRKRYYWVASRVDFGVEDLATLWDFRRSQMVVYEPDPVPTLRETIGDLEPLAVTMVPQRYPYTIAHDCWLHGPHDHTVLGASQWAHDHMHDGRAIVDGHDVVRPPMLARIQEITDDWREGERMSDVLRRYQDQHGRLPRSWDYVHVRDVDGVPVQMTKADRLRDTDFAMGHSQPVRWYGSRPANVVTGGAAHGIVHYSQGRTLTHREVARIQGFPDAWKIHPVRNAADLGTGWGKGVPVHTGRWIAHYAMESLSGRPGLVTGTLESSRERVINLTNQWKKRIFTETVEVPAA